MNLLRNPYAIAGRITEKIGVATFDEIFFVSQKNPWTNFLTNKLWIFLTEFLYELLEHRIVA